HDMRFFAVAYAIALSAALVPANLEWPRWVVAAVLLALYVGYVRDHLRAESSAAGSDLNPLRFHRLDRRAPAHPAAPRLRIVSIQVITALGLIIIGAYAFVAAVEDLAHQLGADEALLALIIAPIATELPEKFNSVI